MGRRSAGLRARNSYFVSLCGALLFVLATRGGARERVDYRDPVREYEQVTKGDLVVFVEKQLLEDSPETARRVVARLVEKRKTALAAFPSSARDELRTIPIYLMYGPKARNGGMSNGLQYLPQSAPDYHPELDPRWRNAISVHCADNYARITDLWALKSLTHEYAHAHHLLHWREKQPEILTAWRNAMDRGLYRDVVDEKGARHALAYAGTNQLEYFAELSAMYFVGGNDPPRTRAELERYDPVGAKMVKTMWALDGAHSPPDTR